MNGLKHIDVLKMFNDDPQTEAVIMVGEIGGTNEEEAARWIKANMKKPVVGFIAGVTAPPGKRMGHAGAIISGGKGTAEEKLAVMEACGIKTTQESGGDGQAAQVGSEISGFSVRAVAGPRRGGWLEGGSVKKKRDGGRRAASPRAAGRSRARWPKSRRCWATSRAAATC